MPDLAIADVVRGVNRFFFDTLTVNAFLSLSVSNLHISFKYFQDLQLLNVGWILTKRCRPAKEFDIMGIEENIINFGDLNLQLRNIEIIENRKQCYKSVRNNSKQVENLGHKRSDSKFVVSTF